MDPTLVTLLYKQCDLSMGHLVSGSYVGSSLLWCKKALLDDLSVFFLQLLFSLREFDFLI